MRVLIAFLVTLTVCSAAISAPAHIAGTAVKPQPAAVAAVNPQNGGAMVPVGSGLEAVLFYLVGGLAAASALGCVLSANIVRMAVWLFGALGAVAILYFLMAATFLAAIQLIVYAGGTLIVIIFGVMLTSKSPWVKFVPGRIELIAGALICAMLFLGLGFVLLQTDWGKAKAAGSFEVAEIGRQLLTTYLVPFELASVLLLAVMIGAAYLARVERK